MHRGSWVGLLLVVGSACEGSESGRALRLLEFRPLDSDSVALNEELLFFFSSDLDRSSITSDSVRILDAGGESVAGERTVRGNTLAFFPELPCASDLSDGGLRPGSDYRVVLGGFPRPDGIRATSGALLSESLVLSFRTAEVGGTGPLFLDPFLGPFALRPLGKRTNPGEIELDDGVLVLEYGEALDPSSVPGCRFELSRFPPGAEERESIPVVARLIENRRDRARLLLEPSAQALGSDRLPPDTYYLHMPGRELRTLGGRPVEPGWKRLLVLAVPEARVELDFGSQRERSDEPPPGCDGTAIWNEAGPGLSVRYPAAAGNGQAGEVELGAAPPGPDLQATRLAVPAGTDVDLGACRGPVVLRSQTALEVRGRLFRKGSGARQDPLTRELERAATLAASRWLPLSNWVERLLDPGQPWASEPWTVLIAGGDLRVPAGGSIEVDGPLVLVAGGWIRVGGNVLSRGNLWHTPECGFLVGDGGEAAMASHVRGGNAELPLALDPPVLNPLRTSLVLGGVSRALPWTPRSGGWRVAYVGHEGIGRLDARFLQGPAEHQVSDPGELGAGPARALVRLELQPGRGEPWDPPSLERLRLEGVPGRLPTPSKP